jgi:hypothetical protein
MLEEFKYVMKKKFEMIDLRLLKVEKSTNGIFVSQQKYATNILKIFRMDTCKPT